MSIVPEDIRNEKEYWTRQLLDGFAAKNMSYESKCKIIGEASANLTRIDKQLLKSWEKQR